MGGRNGTEASEMTSQKVKRGSYNRRPPSCSFTHSWQMQDTQSRGCRAHAKQIGSLHELPVSFPEFPPRLRSRQRLTKGSAATQSYPLLCCILNLPTCTHARTHNHTRTP